MNREYVDQALRAKGSSLDFCGIVWVRVDDPQRVEPLMREIDGMFANSEAVTASETEQTYFKNFFSFLQGLVVVILIVTALVTLCIVFIAANTASMAVRERIGEIAVLRALGFGRRLVFGMLLTEGVLLAAIGGLGGATLAVFLTGMIRSRAALAPQMGPLGNFIVSPTIFVQTLFLALFIGMLSGFVPSFGAARRSVAEALREVV
jgi:putative ABC transport system permease protein